MGTPKVKEGKVVREPLFTKEFWSRLITQAVHSGAAGALSIVTTTEFSLINGASWMALCIGGMTGVITSILMSLSSQGIPGTQEASFLPLKGSG